MLLPPVAGERGRRGDREVATLKRRQVGHELPGVGLATTLDDVPTLTKTAAKGDIPLKTSSLEETETLKTTRKVLEETTTLVPISPSVTSLPRTSSLSSTTAPTKTSSHSLSTLTSALPHSTARNTTSTTLFPPTRTTSHELIFVTSFPPDFPIPTQGRTAREASGRGYAFIRDSKLADAMLLFLTFLGVFSVFTILLIRLTRLHERRKGTAKEDQMVGEDMRWAEGREVIEKRIVWDDATGLGGGGAGRRGRGGEEGSRLGKRQSWGTGG